MFRRGLVFATLTAIWALCYALDCRVVLAYEYTVPETTNDGWEIAALSSEAMNVDLLKKMFVQILEGQFKHIGSVLIVWNGKLVVEEYFPRQEGDRRAQAFRRVSPQEITSATKSVTSILIGMAIDQRLILNVEERVTTLLPEHSKYLRDDDKAKLRLCDLLTMCAGLSWDEWSLPYSDPRNDHIRMLRADDPIRYVFEQSMLSRPGTKFAYSSGVSIVLGEILRKAAKMPVDKFAERHLFEPLGISDFYWSKYPGKIVQTGGGLFLRPRDMAKIGYLYLNSGRWQGRQVVSKDWVKQSTKNHVPLGQIPAAAFADGYGYQWWLSSLQTGGKDVKSYSARGRGGQFIMVVPSEQLVAVFTSPPDNSLTFQPLELMQQYILPAVGSTSSSPVPNQSP